MIFFSSDYFILPSYFYNQYKTMNDFYCLILIYINNKTSHKIR